VRAGARVQQDDGPAARRPVLLADHEVAGAGRGRPMDAAQVVTVAVLAHGHVVFTMERDHVGDRTLGADAVARRTARSERLDARQDDQLAAPADCADPRGQAERVAQPDAERPEPVPAPDVRAHGVGDAAALARPERWDHEARAVAERVVELLLGHEQWGLGRCAVLDPDRDDGRLVDGHPAGPGGALEGQPQRVPPHQQAGDHRQRHEQNTATGQVGEAQHHSGQGEGGPRGHEGPTAGGEDVAQPAHGRLSGPARAP
jgi:hypothetical protein